MLDATQSAKILEYAADVRKFEISLFWSRSLFFWGFIATAIAAYGAAVGAGSRNLQFGRCRCGICLQCRLDTRESQ